MTINDLSMLDPMIHFRMVTGFDGLYRKVTNVSILEYESVKGNCEDFSHGDFIITTLFFAKDDPKLIFDTVQMLVARDVAGLAVKTVYYGDLEQRVKDFADANQFPIFLFDSVRITDILLYTYNVLNAQKESAFYESKIRQMFPAPVPESAILQGVAEINPAFQNNHYCAYLTPRTPSAALAVRESMLQFNRTLSPDKKYTSLVRYGKGWLLLASYPGEAELPDQVAHFHSMLYQYQIEQSSFYCGLSRIHHELKQFDVCLTEAFSANQLAVRDKKPLLRYEEMGVYQILLPQLRSKEFMEYFQTTRSILEEYDGKYNSNLLKTLRAYIECGGKLAQTAEKLFLHVNTVRYRLDKAKELLHMDDFFVQAYIFIKVYDFLCGEQEEL